MIKRKCKHFISTDLQHFLTFTCSFTVLKYYIIDQDLRHVILYSL